MFNRRLLLVIFYKRLNTRILYNPGVFFSKIFLEISEIKMEKRNSNEQMSIFQSYNELWPCLTESAKGCFHLRHAILIFMQTHEHAGQLQATHR